MSTEACEFEGCTNSRVAKGLCRSHYAQQREGRELTPLVDRTSFQLSKVCPKCGVRKARSHFYVRKNGRLQSHCTECLIKQSHDRNRRMREALGVDARF